MFAFDGHRFIAKESLTIDGIGNKYSNRLYICVYTCVGLSINLKPNADIDILTFGNMS